VVRADSVNALKVDPARRFQRAEAFAMPVAPPFSLQRATFAVASEDVQHDPILQQRTLLKTYKWFAITVYY
jgi:hypothetical protein